MAIRFTRLAELDLEEIGDTIAADNPSVALHFIHEIREHCKRIAAMPTRGCQPDDLRVCGKTA